MPNNITNRLQIKATTKERVQEVLVFLRGKPLKDGTPRHIDFNKIIPMPEALKIEDSSVGSIGMQYLLASNRVGKTEEDMKAIRNFEEFDCITKERAILLGRQYLSNIEQYGYATWYSWSNARWGTKWNAYDTELQESDTIWFHTAWAGVPCLIATLSEKFPDVEFEYAFADEDLGSNIGEGTIQDGDISMSFPVAGSNEAYEMLFRLLPEMEEYFVLTDEGYVMTAAG